MIYPEHEKLHKVADESQAIGEFVEWLQSKYTLCVYNEERFNGTWWPITINIQDLLAEYFQIDQSKIEEERSEMLKEIRGENESLHAT